MRHNHPGGSIRITTARTAARSSIEVCNTGPVVAADDVDDLFQPFRRGTTPLPQRLGPRPGRGEGHHPDPPRHPVRTPQPGRRPHPARRTARPARRRLNTRTDAARYRPRRVQQSLAISPHHPRPRAGAGNRATGGTGTG
ncbi:hypothetical protein ACF1D3_27510 [Streptomyces sp. NPDC014728]|uniref:hypothetical protein n=1 Tax=unclassified Streptomyces TaxID=2593676 RepID=UPI0036F64D6F